MVKCKSFEEKIDEKIVFDQLNGSANAVWSLLLATRYLKVLDLKSLDVDEEVNAIYKSEESDDGDTAEKENLGMQ